MGEPRRKSALNAGRTVQMITTIDDDAIVYEVFDGDTSGGDLSTARGVWVKSVDFGRSAFTRPGGAAFVEAAREQEAFAMRLRAMTDGEVEEIVRERRREIGHG